MMKRAAFSFLSLAGLVLNVISVQGARFIVNSPVLTITVKEPNSASTISNKAKNAHQNNDNDNEEEAEQKPWFDLSALSPNLLWSVQSKRQPLPNWLPALTSIRLGVGYDYNELKQIPSKLEFTGKFAVSPSSELQIQPSYDAKLKKSNLLVQFSRGASYVVAQFGSAAANHVVEGVRASLLFRTPSAAISSVRFTPSVDLEKKTGACTIEAVTGGSGRTTAILHLERKNPTLSIVYSLGDRNVIAPEISLYDAKIIYQWIVDLGSGSSVRTKVDPTTAITITWTDRCTVGGNWVTDIRLPLDDNEIHGLAADVRVRRQFVF